LESNPTVARSADSGRTRKHEGIQKINPTFPRLNATKKWGMYYISFHYPLPIVYYHALYIKDHTLEKKSSRFSPHPNLLFLVIKVPHL
jgi:hypothetical protein